MDHDNIDIDSRDNNCAVIGIYVHQETQGGRAGDGRRDGGNGSCKRPASPPTSPANPDAGGSADANDGCGSAASTTYGLPAAGAGSISATTSTDADADGSTAAAGSSPDPGPANAGSNPNANPGPHTNTGTDAHTRIFTAGTRGGRAGGEKTQTQEEKGA